MISAVFDELLSYIKARPGVWLVRHDELARWVMARELSELSYRERFFSPAQKVAHGPR